MKTTIDELRNLFKLDGNDLGVLKMGLENKIKYINENNIEATDDELKDILIKFRSGGSYTLNEVCALYDISKQSLITMINTKKISFFRLSSAVGSKVLFLKSELKKETDILFEHHKYTPVFNFLEFGKQVLSDMKDYKIIDTFSFDVLVAHYINNNSYYQISLVFNLPIEKVKKIIDTNQNHILNSLNFMLKDRENFGEAIKKYNELNQKYEKVCEQLNSTRKENNHFVLADVADGLNPLARISLRDIDISVRTLNCLLGSDIETLEQLYKIKKRELLLIRNFGKKCLEEVVDIFAEKGIKY